MQMTAVSPADLPVLIFSTLSLTAVLYALCFISKTSQSLIQNICALLREKARFSALVCPTHLSSKCEPRVTLNSLLIFNPGFPTQTVI